MLRDEGYKSHITDYKVCEAFQRCIPKFEYVIFFKLNKCIWT